MPTLDAHRGESGPDLTLGRVCLTYRGYVAAGLDKKDIAFEVDDKILA